MRSLALRKQPHASTRMDDGQAVLLFFAALLLGLIGGGALLLAN